VFAAVSVGETGLAVAVSVRGSGPGVGDSVPGKVVGETAVWVTESVVGVEGTDVKVACPLHAAMNNTNKRMKRFIRHFTDHSHL
jgi:hypothetical protein